MDTLHADYAFIVATSPVPRSLIAEGESEEEQDGWDFLMYPNPTQEELYIVFPDGSPKEVTICDPEGRQVILRSAVTGPVLTIHADGMAKGIYYVKIHDGQNGKTKKLIIQ